MFNGKIKVLIACGEESGSNIADSIIKNLENIYGKNSIELFGIVGESFKQKHKITEIFPMKEISVMGFSKIIVNLFSILKKIKVFANFVKNNEIDLIITVDSYDFFYRAVKKIREFNKKIPIFHIVSPSVWIYRENRAKKMANVYDMLLCIFPHEPKYFENTKLKTIFVGNPIFDIDFGNFKKNPHQIAITIGSRAQEIKNHAKIIIEVIEILNTHSNKLSFKVLSTKETYHLTSSLFNGFKNVQILDNETKKRKAMVESSLAIAKSGTNVLEFIAARTIPVVYYKTSIVNFVVAFLVGVRFVNIFNIIKKREVFKEFVQFNAKPKKIANHIIRLIFNSNFFNMDEI